MNRSAREGKSVKRFERSNGPDIALYKNYLYLFFLELPPHVKYNQSVTGLAKDYHGRPYVDDLCLFRCMGLHLGHDPNTLYAKYTDQPVETFEGVTIDELQKADILFEVNIIVYKLSDTSAQLVRRSLYKHANTIYLNLQYMKRTSHLFTILKEHETLQ